MGLAGLLWRDASDKVGSATGRVGSGRHQGVAEWLASRVWVLCRWHTRVVFPRAHSLSDGLLRVEGGRLSREACRGVSGKGVQECQRMLADAGCLDDVCACIQRGQLGTGRRGLIRSFLPPLGKRRVGGSY